MSHERLNYLNECHRSAREELLFRVKHRDAYLKFQLTVQVVIWGLINGVTFLGSSTSEGKTLDSNFSALCLPISFVFAGLYFVENGLIGKMSLYIKSLTDKELELCKTSNSEQEHRKIVIYNWESSEEFEEYRKKFNLLLRSITQFFVFLLLPLVVSVEYHKTLNLYNVRSLESLIQLVSGTLIGLLIVYGYLRRREG